MIVRVNYVRAASRSVRKIVRGGGTHAGRSSSTLRAVLARHLRYLERRPAGTNETHPPRLFAAAHDAVTRADALAALLPWAHPQRAFYRMILSPAGPKADEVVEAWPDYTRRVLAAFAAGRGVRLRWVAAYHTNTVHPHVHVVFAGGWRDQEGRLHLLKLDRDDLAALRTIGRAETAYPERQHDLAVLAAEERAEERAEGVRWTPGQRPAWAQAIRCHRVAPVTAQLRRRRDR